MHVLCEKPMAVTVDECQRMIDACDEHGVKLMIAYRLHFEEINLKAVDLVRRGRIGDPKFFDSSFAMTVRRGNIRTKKDLGGGDVVDIGVYCINAARYLFRASPARSWRSLSTAAPPSSTRSTNRPARFCDLTAISLKTMKRRLGPAWLERDGAGVVQRRRGRPRAGYLDEHAAIVAKDRLVREIEASWRTARPRHGRPRPQPSPSVTSHTPT